MVLLRRSREKCVQLDADWLLGSEASTANAMDAGEAGPALATSFATSTDTHYDPESMMVGAGPKASHRVSSQLSGSQLSGQQGWKRWLLTGSSTVVVIALLVAGIANWDSVKRLLSTVPWPAIPFHAESSEDTLRTMMELSAMATQSNSVLIKQLATADAESRLAAFQSLCGRIDGLSTHRTSLSQRIALVHMLQSVPTTDAEVSRMRGMLASQLLRGLALNDPAIQSTREALVAMLDAPTSTPNSTLEIETSTESSYESASASVQVGNTPSTSAMAAMHGLQNLSMEQVLRLIQSRQSRIVKAATLELRRRGLDDAKLELVFAMAHGSRAARLEAMESADQRFGVESVPLLIWMAETSEEEVRTKAITLLSAKPDSRTIPALRALQSRETDDRIVLQIDEVLLASGSNLSSQR